ncbi:MAG: hypothetical protein L0H70_00975 [Xanthomonadales bacterium]|nr:hypothetical protein [Xanthomonadales bacterium]
MLARLCRKIGLFLVSAMVCLLTPALAQTKSTLLPAASSSTRIAALEAQVAALKKAMPQPELGRQMLELQIRHDRLWWAGQAGNWNLAYYMVGELGEALRGIESSNGDAAELQPQKLSTLMPSIMNPAIKSVQQALATHDRAKFERAFDGLSAACSACHQVAGVSFLHIQRPQIRLLDNLRYAPDTSTKP